MKSKIFVEVLKTQLEKSLELLNKELESSFKLEDKEFKLDDKPTFGLQLTQETESGERRIWFRRYEGTSNDIKAGAYSELFDIIIGTFLVNASRSDNATLEKLSNGK